MMKDSNARVLIVEDEQITRDWTDALLRNAGYKTWAVSDAKTAKMVFKEFSPHVALLDLVLPDATDFDLTQTISSSAYCGIIIISGLAERSHRLDGLRYGADDYLTKPFDTEELLLKVKHLVQRIRVMRATDPNSAQHYYFGDWLFQPPSPRLIGSIGYSALLTETEIKVLSYFVSNSQQVISREQLKKQIWGSNQVMNNRAVDSCISRLRKKIEPYPAKPKWLKSVYGGGYLLDCEVTFNSDEKDGY